MSSLFLKYFGNVFLEFFKQKERYILSDKKKDFYRKIVVSFDKIIQVFVSVRNYYI